MKSTHLSLLFAFSVCAGNAAASNIVFCNLISAPSKSLEDATGTSASKQACDLWIKNPSIPLPFSIYFETNPQYNNTIYLSRKQTAPPGPIYKYIIFNKKTKIIEFDKAQFNAALNDWPVYQSRIEKILSITKSITTKVKLKYAIRDRGSYVSCEITYLDENGRERWNLVFLSISKEKSPPPIHRP
jgi:hypothetical protein